MLPAAPPRVSTTHCCPMKWLRFGVTIRASASAPPPGANGTSSRIGRVGYSLGAAAIDHAKGPIENSVSATVAILRLRRDMKRLLWVGYGAPSRHAAPRVRATWRARSRFDLSGSGRREPDDLAGIRHI